MRSNKEAAKVVKEKLHSVERAHSRGWERYKSAKYLKKRVKRASTRLALRAAPSALVLAGTYLKARHDYRRDRHNPKITDHVRNKRAADTVNAGLYLSDAAGSVGHAAVDAYDAFNQEKDKGSGNLLAQRKAGRAFLRRVAFTPIELGTKIGARRLATAATYKATSKLPWDKLTNSKIRSDVQQVITTGVSHVASLAIEKTTKGVADAAGSAFYNYQHHRDRGDSIKDSARFAIKSAKRHLIGNSLSRKVSRYKAYRKRGFNRRQSYFIATQTVR